MSFPRSTGILLHPSSLPSRGGIGDLGPAAYDFADFLSAASQGIWQVLPLGPLGYGYSPYSSTSAFAGNPLLISLERLAEHGWIASSRLESLPAPGDKVDYPKILARKLPLLQEAAANFLQAGHSAAHAKFEDFCAANAWWLDDFVLFDALRTHHKNKAWNEWPRAIACREPKALDQARKTLHQEVQAGRAIQFAFYEQWKALHHYCTQRSICIIGDIAIFVNFDSADVWTNPQLFRLDANLDPEVVAGVPPDFFSETGQRWGCPLYRWDVMQESGYDWWIRRLEWATRNCDYIRLDHFRGFDQFWEIPADEPTAVNGRWVDGPKDDFFSKLREALGGLPFFAEDLGHITPSVHALRERLEIPGMAVLQFGFGDKGARMYLPHRFTAGKVVYTGTHDNDTVAGWWNNGAQEHERRHARAYLGPMDDGVHWAFIRAAQASVASLSVVPLQDVLGLGSEARLNTPSVNDGNWGWRFRAGDLTQELAEKLAALAEVTDRAPEPPKPSDATAGSAPPLFFA
jgi:4-alpha-glucanotransferase